MYVSPKLAMIALGIVPPIAVMSIIYGRYVRKITRQVQDSLAGATSVFHRMSFQSVDSDEFVIFSTGSCSPDADSAIPQFSTASLSPGADSPLQRYGSVEFAVNDDETVRRNSEASTVDDELLYREVLGTDVSKEDSVKVENTHGLLDSVGHTVNDFTSASATTSVNLPPVLTNRSVSVSWNKSGTSTTPVSWDTPGTSSPQHVNFTLGDDTSPHQQNKEQYAYDSVSFDRPKPHNNLLLEEALSRNRTKIPQLPQLSRLHDLNPGGLENINNQCYEAAISEHFKHKKHSKLRRYVSKMKNSKPHSGNSHVYDTHQRESPVQSPTKVKPPGELPKPPLTSQMLANDSVSKVSNVTKTTFSTFTMPSIPSPLSPFSTGSQSPCQADGQRSPKAPKDPDLKKYRYNQTALALQQSGLMKTTIKTAELLRKSRLLQQELTKLRRETAVFVTAVLNNPENKHLKNMYMPQQQSDIPVSQ